MRIIAWITTAFGTLAAGVAMASFLDELLNHAAQLSSHRWSQEVIVRTAIIAGVSVTTMALWAWFWMRYVIG